jgi:hypothetical protein
MAMGLSVAWRLRRRKVAKRQVIGYGGKTSGAARVPNINPPLCQSHNPALLAIHRYFLT